MTKIKKSVYKEASGPSIKAQNVNKNNKGFKKVFTLGLREALVLSSDLSGVQEDVAAREALSESRSVGVWVGRHHNLVVALVEALSYLDAYLDTKKGRNYCINNNNILSILLPLKCTSHFFMHIPIGGPNGPLGGTPMGGGGMPGGVGALC